MTHDKIDALLEALDAIALASDTSYNGLPLTTVYDKEKLRSAVAEHFQRWAGEGQQCLCKESFALLRKMRDEHIERGSLSGRLQYEAEEHLQRLGMRAALPPPEPKPAQWLQIREPEGDDPPDMFAQCMGTSDTSPISQQEIVSAIHHHASEIARLTEAWPTEQGLPK
jgi:hypothetical protein